MAKQLNFFDQASSSTTPTIGNLVASNLITYTDDAAYVAGESGAPVEGNVYFNTTLKLVRYYTGAAWVSILDETSTQVVTNKTISGTSNTLTNLDGDNVIIDAISGLTATDAQAAFAEHQTEIETNATDILNKMDKITGVDNVLPKMDTTSGAIQNTGITVDDTDNVTGVNDLTLDGNLTVNGTTTTVNTANLDVTDKNITVNNTGDDASSEGAGLTVDRTGTNGSFVYEDALAAKFKLGAVGSEVEVADVSSIQAITNKDIDGGTASNTSRITLPKDTTANLALLTNKAGTVAYDTTLGSFVLNDGSGWNEVSGAGGGSGSKNYFDDVNNNLNKGVITDFGLFNDGVPYVDGTGGVSNIVISASNISTERLEGEYGLRIDKIAVDSSGQGFSLSTRTIDRSDYGREQLTSIEIDFTHANYTSGDFVIKAYDITNSAEIPVVGLDNGIPKLKGKIQFKVLPTDTTQQYRLSLFLETDSNPGLSYVAYADDFKSGPDKTVPGFISYKPVAYTPTFTGFGTVSNINIVQWREGSFLKIKGVFTSGTSTAVQAKISLPSGLTSKSTIPALEMAGSWAKNVSGDDGWMLASTSKTYLNFGIIANGSFGLVAQNANNVASNTNLVSIEGSVEIEGWVDSNSISATENLFRNALVRGEDNAGTTITANTTNIDFGEIKDEQSLWDGSVFTAAVDGEYKFVGNINITVAGLVNISAHVDRGSGFVLERRFGVFPNSGNGPFSGALYLNAGDKVAIRINANKVLNITTSGHHIDITMEKSSSVFGVNGQVDNKAITLAADYYQSSPAVNTWYVPNNSFKLDLTPGKYKLRLKGVSFPSSSSATNGNMINVDFQLGTSPSGGSGLIGEKATFHHGSYAGVNFYPKEFDYTFDEEFITSSSVTIYVHIRRRAFSGSPTITNIGMRSESGSGNGIDPVLIAERIS